jgi:ClpP class serine protease
MTTTRTLARPASAPPVELYLFAEVGAWGVTADQFVAELRAVRGRDVVLHISSPGGDLLDAIAMFNALRQHNGRTTAYISALCASAATVVALGCDDRVTSPRGSG